MTHWFKFDTKNDVELMRIFLPGALAVFSTRHGGSGNVPFDTMNLAFHVGDKPENVRENRKRFTAAANISLDNLVCANQVHGTNIKLVTSEDRGKGAYNQENALPETDGIITSERDLIPGVFFADCVPIFLADPVQGAVGLVHAGWKGTLNGIAGKTVAGMVQAFGSRPSDCWAFIGPSIGPCCYAVGEEVLSFFSSGRWRAVAPFAKKQDKWSLDLWAANKANLLEAGLSCAKIGLSQICTCCDKRFFSYRKDGGRTGRMGAFIQLMQDPAKTVDITIEETIERYGTRALSQAGET